MQRMYYTCLVIYHKLIGSLLNCLINQHSYVIPSVVVTKVTNH